MALSKRILSRIATIVVILIILGVLWYVKNRPETEQPGVQQVPAATVEVASETISVADGVGNQAEPVVAQITEPNPDFFLSVTEVLDLEQLKSYGLPIMIDFGADSCIPCKEMAPILKDLNSKLQGKAIIRFVDVWKDPKLSEGFPIRVIPTQMFFDSEGKPFRPADPDASQMLMYVLKDTEEHVFTAHEGGMTEQMIMQALQEMGLSHD